MEKDHAFESFEMEGKSVHIVADDSPESPREWDNLGVMFCDHRRYNLGDTEKEISTSDCGSWADVEAKLVRQADARVILPLYLLDHSGITISTSDFSDPWDSGQVGFIYATGKGIREAFGVKKVTAKLLESVREILESEVSIYDSFLRGDTYGYVIEDSSGEEIEACYGYYSIADAKESATYALQP
jgi:hypothetical protein